MGTTRELAHITKYQSILSPASYTATQTSAAIDTQGTESLEILFQMGAWVSGTWQLSLTECDTTGGTYTAVADSQMEFFQIDASGVKQRLGVGIANSPIVSSAPTANTLISVSLVGGLKRFAKAVVTGATTPSGVFGLVALKGHPRETVGFA